MLDALLGNRDERRRRKAVDDLGRREQLLRPGYKVWGYQNVFAKGFVVTDGPSAFSPREGWDHLSIGRWHVRLDTVLERQHAASSVAEVLVLGQAFDDGGPKTRDRIAERILRAVSKHPGVDEQTRALDETIAWLSGRYVVLVARGDRLEVYGDPLATRSVFWHRGAAGVALASHTAILSQLAGGLDNARMRWVLGHPDYVDPAGRWLPGLITPHDEVEQLYANARLTVRGTEVVHERFFPFEDRVELAPLEASERFRDDLIQQVRNWISVAPVTVLALTAGRDSKAILQAGLPDLQRAGALTMTYHAFRSTGKSSFFDMMAASRLAAAAQLHHIPIDIPPLSPRSEMGKLYATTFPTWQRFANLANALYLGSPAKATTLFGVGGAVITGMYRDTSALEPTPELLAKKYAQSRFGEEPLLHEELARWMEFTQFSVAAMRGHDFHDFYHWEHRMTKWGGAGYSEYDLATTPAPVLSSRRLLMAALALPKPQRVDALVYRFIAEGESALNEDPQAEASSSDPA
ncbi:hypothetical protein [Agrococcus sp. ARC_14]|uniref:hypothetical protein n=1 Tax=Agrococcus sp. ARC_14 TaxID=2919927 RepID=UPI001F06FB6F|nr:hypothetical protein [Agrococcus sp. ARC_14]MCH1884313.1 hypothetical protein [Agrococcus sp. ARC_14]